MSYVCEYICSYIASLPIICKTRPYEVMTCGHAVYTCIQTNCRRSEKFFINKRSYEIKIVVLQFCKCKWGYHIVAH